MWRFLSIVFDLKRTHQLSLLPDKDSVNLCPPIEPYQVTKSQSFVGVGCGVWGVGCRVLPIFRWSVT
ncbi:hypothetical protein [Microcystis aeruginosa]|uniref:hypothetical protein n=1 Tax=Microcystis aeruginosa TaxID=1126 RepID=UPI00209BDA3D|nr:hypothetical protein [Microcystis aeruginosa]